MVDNTRVIKTIYGDGMRILLQLLALVLLTIICFSCKKDSLVSPQNQPQVNLSILETASTEVWLKVQTKNISLPVHFQLLMNDSLNRPVYMDDSSEIKLYVNSLLPESVYQFKISQAESSPIESNTVTVKTLDTTSNEITWHAFQFSNKTIGDGSLWSVCVENDQSVWCAGEYHMEDSLGQYDSDPYGLVNWDGNKLNYYKVYCKDFGSEHYYPHELTCVFEVENQMYATTYGQLLKKEGNNWQGVAIFMQESTFNKVIYVLGGTGSDNLYCAGWNGGIFHVTLQGWEELESHTTNQFLDISSYIDPLNGNKVSLFVSTDWGLSMKYLTKVINNSITDTIPIGVELFYSVWTKNGFPIFVSGPGIITNKHFDFSGVPGIRRSTFTQIRGTELNDIFTCTITGEIYHYNGSNWKLFNNFYEVYPFYRISVRGNTIALIGDNNGKPVIVIGRRN
jgi:hypothetical protein